MAGGQLLVYQGGVLLVWLGACELCAVWAAAVACGSNVAATRSWGERARALARVTSCVAGAQALLALVRHRSVRSRRRVFSRGVALLRAVAMHAVSHAAHAVAGYAMLRWFAGSALTQGGRCALSAEEASPAAVQVGAANGLFFSVAFFACAREELSAAGLQTRRLGRVRAAAARALKGSLMSAALCVALLATLAPGGLALPPARLLLLGWAVQLWLALGAELYTVIATEAKRTGLCARLPVSDAEEAALLAGALSRADPGSLEESLLGLPLRSERPASAPPGSLLARAKVAALAQARGAGHGASADWRSSDSAARDSVLEWWAAARQAAARAPCEPWESLASLRQRRVDAVTQAVYALDASQPGAAFRARGALSGSAALERLRAFQDLACLAESSAARRRVLLAERDVWQLTLEACLAVVDAQALLLTVATRDAALEPTEAVRAATGQSLVDALVPPGVVGARERARMAEAAARSLRRQPWFSVQWWRQVATEPLQEHDPVVWQLSREASARSAGETKGAGANGAGALGGSRRADADAAAAAAADAPTPGPRWELHWRRRQRWQLGAVLGLLQRSPAERARSILADHKVVMLATKALSELVARAASGEDPAGNSRDAAPAVLDSLLTCTLALEDFVRSPDVAGDVEAEPSQLARQEALELHFCLERGLFALVTALRDKVPGWTFSAHNARALRRYIDFTA